MLIDCLKDTQITRLGIIQAMLENIICYFFYF